MKGEQWKAINNHPDYEVSDYGRIRSTKFNRPGRVMRPGTTTFGRKQVVLRTNLVEHHRFVHRLVLEAFSGPAPIDKPETNHKDGNPLNNNLENLEWVSRIENMRHRLLNNLHGHKMNPAKARLACRWYGIGGTLEQIGLFFGVTAATISRIVNKKIWVFER